LPELLLHPADRRTGVRYSLLPMTQATLGALFTPQQAQHHLGLIRKHLRFPDGVRLMDRPLAYHGGPQTLFQRAESAAFFGREIGLMYIHAHLRYAQAMAVLGEAQDMWDALLLANPIAVTERLSRATLRQRNAYFSSSDAAFRDRYQACEEWQRVRDGTIAVDGGWRIYSSGPGLYVNVLIAHALGVRRQFGVRIVRPCLPAPLRGLRLEWTLPPVPG
jgi:cellobiose phosphorylase